MVQPILDKHCVSCHGGEKDIAAGMDLSGGWTEHFNISYENLANRRETQLIAYWIAGIDCMNGTAPWSCQIFPPRGHGSGAAPLAKLLVSGHDGQIPNLSRPERDLLMAWIDTNGLYHGNWDSTQAGCAIRDWNSLKAALTAQMQAAGCLRCHGDGQKILYFENDWINLRDPGVEPDPARTVGQGRPGVRVEPVPRPQGGPRAGSEFICCGKATPTPSSRRKRFPSVRCVPYDPSGQPVVSFASTDDPYYQAMLAIIRDARDMVLANPRVDMPGAEVIPGACRHVPSPAVAGGRPGVDRDDGCRGHRTVVVGAIGPDDRSGGRTASVRRGRTSRRMRARCWCGLRCLSTPIGRLRSASSITRWSWRGTLSAANRRMSA